jgi:hypothetical protein
MSVAKVEPEVVGEVLEMMIEKVRFVVERLRVLTL